MPADAEPTPTRRPPASTPVADRLSIDAALDELPEDFRVAVVLRDVGDLDYAEIAEALGVPIGTVKSRIARGRRHARRAAREPRRPVATSKPSDTGRSTDRPPDTP